MPRWPRRFGAAIVASAVSLTLASCHSAAGDRSGPTIGEIRSVLDRHAAAVLRHDTAAFLADVDPAAPAAAFRSRQRAEISALDDVPLRGWAYTVSAPVTDSSAVQAAGARLHAPAAIVHLALSYQLATGDPQPSVHDLWWTFVRRNGRVVIAGDDDLATKGGQSWRGPWDFGSLVVRSGASSVVLSHPDHAATATRLLPVADAAVRAVAMTIPTGWSKQVVIVIPSTSPEFDELAGSLTTVGDIAADTVFDPAPGPDGAPTGARILIDPAALSRLSAIGLQITLTHEVTHVALAARTSESSPRWVVEGTAEYIALAAARQPVRTAAAELRSEILRSGAPGSLPTDASFASPGAPAAYEASWLACRYVATRVGAAGLLRFYDAVANAVGPGDEPVQAALHTVLHESLASFVAGWRRYVTSELR